MVFLWEWVVGVFIVFGLDVVVVFFVQCDIQILVFFFGGYLQWCEQVYQFKQQECYYGGVQECCYYFECLYVDLVQYVVFWFGKVVVGEYVQFCGGEYVGQQCVQYIVDVVYWEYVQGIVDVLFLFDYQYYVEIDYVGGQIDQQCVVGVYEIGCWGNGVQVGYYVGGDIQC